MKINKLIVFVVLCIFTATAHAEYYISDGCNGSGCYAPCPVKRVYKRHYPVKKHYYRKRCSSCNGCAPRYRRNSYTVTVRYYYPRPVCGCERVYVPSKCGCGRYSPGYWTSVPRTYVRYSGPYGGYTYTETWYSPVNDRATADDYGSEMEIN